MSGGNSSSSSEAENAALPRDSTDANALQAPSTDSRTTGAVVATSSQQRQQESELDVTCAICHDKLLDPVTTPCGHNYCKLCLNRWLRRSHKCPLDNAVLPKVEFKVNHMLQSLVWANNTPAELQERRELSYPDTVVVPYCSESIQVKRGRPISDSIDVGRISGLKSAAQSPPARNDMWECLVDIGRGVYDITCTGGANCYHGKLQLYLNGVKCGRVLDWYCEATCHPISFYVCGVRVEESGAHTLRGEVVGKAPKSNDFWICLNEIKFQRTTPAGEDVPATDAQSV